MASCSTVLCAALDDSGFPGVPSYNVFAFGRSKLHLSFEPASYSMTNTRLLSIAVYVKDGQNLWLPLMVFVPDNDRIEVVSLIRFPRPFFLE